jgi:Cytotoxic
LSYIPIPKPSILDDCIKHRVKNRKQIWKSIDGKRFYTWDGRHGELEVFNKKGFHIGSFDPVNGEMLKSAVQGRKLDVK